MECALHMSQTVTYISTNIFDGITARQISANTPNNLIRAYEENMLGIDLRFQAQRTLAAFLAWTTGILFRCVCELNVKNAAKLKSNLVGI